MEPSTAHRPMLVPIDDDTPGITTEFVGDEHGSQSSFYISRSYPGHGPGLHTHPYTETFIVEQGNVRFRVGDEEIDVSAGTIVVVPPETPHGFRCLGPEPMRSVNIHASPRMITRWI